MSTLDQNYENRKGKKKKILLILLSLIASILLFAGVVSAFFSDVISRPGGITTGTLTLSGTCEYFLNDAEEPIDKIGNFNPGDVAVIKWTVSNTGNKSAWVRNEIAFSSPDLLQFFKIYDGNFSKDAVKTPDENMDDLLLTPSENGDIITPVRVLDGFGTDAESENNDESYDYDFVGDSTYVVYFTIYFLDSAGNEAQGQILDFIMTAKAIQFRNNSDSIPDDNAWASVEAVVS